MKKRVEDQLQGFIKTPPLWHGVLEELQQFNFPNLQFDEDLNIESMLPSLASNFVMGKRMESYFELVIQHAPAYKLLANNIQISKNKITLGELDFLLKDLQNNSPIHVEMVYKFYVYDPSFSSGLEAWIGPNRKDSLLQKIRKLKEKQFPLLFRPETKTLLNSLKINAELIKQQTCFKANLFIPKNLSQSTFPDINNNCIAGIWVHFQEFISAEYKDFYFFAPKKQDWPINPGFGERWYNHSDIIKQIEALFLKKKAPLIWIKKPGNFYERIFVVWW